MRFIGKLAQVEILLATDNWPLSTFFKLFY